MNKSDLLIVGPKKSSASLILAHGAGAPMDSDWMNSITDLMCDRGIRVIRFEFPYMHERRLTGNKRPPNPTAVLLQTWKDVVGLVGDGKTLCIGGKSMGGRIASMVADDLGVQALVCLGYPFHAAGKPLGDRVAHLVSIKTPTLILQGERDSMGSKDELEGVKLSKNVTLKWLADGDHDLRPRKTSGVQLNDNLQLAVDYVAEFVSAV